MFGDCCTCSKASLLKSFVMNKRRKEERRWEKNILFCVSEFLRKEKNLFLSEKYVIRSRIQYLDQGVSLIQKGLSSNCRTCGDDRGNLDNKFLMFEKRTLILNSFRRAKAT